MKKLFVLLPFLLVTNNYCSNKSGLVLNINAPHTLVSGLKDHYALDETATIQLTPKPYFTLPKKEQIEVEYGGKDFLYNEDTGVLEVKLIANTIINVDAGLNLGNNVDYEEWDRWCNARDARENNVFKSISVSWDFKDDGGTSTSVKDNLNMDLVPIFLLQNDEEEWSGIPELLTDLTGTFTHQWEEGETISGGRDFVGKRSNLASTNNEYSIYGEQSIVFTNTFAITSQTKDILSTLGDVIIFFDENVRLSKLIVTFDNFYSPFASDGPLTGTLEFNYVY